MGGRYFVTKGMRMDNTSAADGRPGLCRIVIDTCADLTPEVAATLDVDILGFPYILDGEEFTDDIWSTHSILDSSRIRLAGA